MLTPVVDSARRLVGSQRRSGVELALPRLDGIVANAGVVQLGSLSALGKRLRFDDLMHDRRRAPAPAPASEALTGVDLRVG